MPDREIRRPSSWLFSMGIASAAVGTRIMAAIESGVRLQGAGYYAAMWVSVTGTLLALIHGTHLLVLALALLPNVRDWYHRLRPPAVEPTVTPALPPPPMTRYTRIIPGTVNGRPTTIEIEDMRPARWSAWQQTAFELMAWYRVTGKLTYSRMVGAGKAFARNEHLQAVYEELDRVGLVRLVNGQETVLVDTLPSTLAILRGGKVEWTDESDPPSIAPAPLKRGWQSDNSRESGTALEQSESA